MSSGEPLPAPFRAFEAQRAFFRKSAISMIAGPPGSMKTMLTLNIVDRIRVPTLYFSNDSDDYTVATRVLAMKAGVPMSETEQWTKTHVEYATAQLQSFDHVKWSFHPAPTMEHIEREMDAFAEIRGDYPEHTVIDIMMNVDYDGVGEQNYWGLMNELHYLSRKWNTALTVVHHTSEAVKGEPCPPRHAIMGKANQLPVLILTLNGRPDAIDVAVVKNRFGPSDLTGRTSFPLQAEPWCSRVIEDEDASQPNEPGLPAGRVDAGPGDGTGGLFAKHVPQDSGSEHPGPGTDQVV
jgi:hypothetical protein